MSIRADMQLKDHTRVRAYHQAAREAGVAEITVPESVHVHLDGPDGDSLSLWGDPAVVRQVLADAIIDLDRAVTEAGQ